MRHIVKIVFVMLVVFLYNCENKSVVKEKHIDNHTAKENKSDLELTDEQIKLAQIKVENMKTIDIGKYVRATGHIQAPPKSLVNVHAILGGFVKKAFVIEGDKVKKGDKLAIVQHPLYLELQKLYIETRNELKVKKIDYIRKSKLYKQGIISQSEFQEIDANYLTLSANYTQLKLKLKSMGITPKNIDKKGIQNEIVIYAPIKGIITKQNINLGKYIAENEYIYQILDRTHLHAEIEVFSKDVHKIKKGMPFEFEVNGYPIQFKGEVEKVNQKIDPVTRTANVHGHFEDKQNILKQNQFITCKIFLSKHKAKTVPEKAVIMIDGEKYIFVKNSKNTFAKKRVFLGDYNNARYEIKMIEGNDFGLPVVIQGAYELNSILIKNSGQIVGCSHGH